MRPMPDKNIYCGATYCSGGHKWLPGQWSLDSINCGAHREYTAAEMAKLDELKEIVSKSYNRENA